MFLRLFFLIVDSIPLVTHTVLYDQVGPKLASPCSSWEMWYCRSLVSAQVLEDLRRREWGWGLVHPHLELEDQEGRAFCGGMRAQGQFWWLGAWRSLSEEYPDGEGKDWNKFSLPPPVRLCVSLPISSCFGKHFELSVFNFCCKSNLSIKLKCELKKLITKRGGVRREGVYTEWSARFSPTCHLGISQFSPEGGSVASEAFCCPLLLKTSLIISPFFPIFQFSLYYGQRLPLSPDFEDTDIWLFPITHSLYSTVLHLSLTPHALTPTEA